MISKRYNLVNNVGGWVVFVIALVTYWLTLEPTASYWDCGEFIIQADKLEVGHPPGNPIFMLTARFFANFAGGDSSNVALMVNAMSGLLSALTILLLFWTISHLTRRLVVKDGQRKELSLQQYLVIFGAATVGSLAYCWSDTFWFSAVEGEVYAFSSFCTALVFWLILKWENRADEPHSDRYLILIAYIIGVSVAVHLLNLLCIPAIVLVFAYRKFNEMNLVKSLVALVVSFAIIVLVLYGLVPGFIRIAQEFELLCVNGLGMSFNSGTVIYAVLTAGVIIWSLVELSRLRSSRMVKISFILAVMLSGMFLIGDSWIIGIILTLGLAYMLFDGFKRFGIKLPVRVMNVIMWSIGVIFVGYSSYALILIRSNARTPMNQNAPDNVFDLASYLNREQYGEAPLLYGETFESRPQMKQTAVRTDTITTSEDGTPITLVTPSYEPINEAGKVIWSKGVKGHTPESLSGFLTDADMASNQKLAERGKDYYVKKDYTPEPKYNPELNMLFPRIYSSMHRSEYGKWVSLDTVPANMVALSAIDAETGEEVAELNTGTQPEINEMYGTVGYPQRMAYKPTFSQNLAYFVNYQISHMYMRYFMWNFAGRQNDILNQSGELDAGNWISGIPFIDNPRLGDQSKLPEPLGEGNKGHNTFYMLPLLLGIVGLLWQAFAGRRGIEQFWVVFFLFFMTGIAIVLYLNQPPAQPRERDYAFAGSFYAFAIWIGMGVAGLWRLFVWILGEKAGKNKAQPIENLEDEATKIALPKGCRDEEELQSKAMTEEPARYGKISRIGAALACLLGLVVPIQMVSQTWDDHDRSGRYAARDYAINYLESLEPNAIVFCNGDNDTFPLWYVQEVEGVRRDVRIINLSYLNSTWYTDQQLVKAYEAEPIDIMAKPEDYAYDKLQVSIVDTRNRTPMDLGKALKAVYSGESKVEGYPYPAIPTSIVTVPVDKKAVVARGLVAPADTAQLANEIAIDLSGLPTVRSQGYIPFNNLIVLDIIATNAAKGWPRPIYWCSSVGSENLFGFDEYLRSTGMAFQLTPVRGDGLMAPRAERAYEVITKKYKWGGADVKPGEYAPYFDETAGRMLTAVRSSINDLAVELIYQGDKADKEGNRAKAMEEWRKAAYVAGFMESKVSEGVMNYSLNNGMTYAEVLTELGSVKRLNDPKLIKKGQALLVKLMERYAPYLLYNQAMRLQFGNPSFTIETTYAPYQYYKLIELYEGSGGNASTVNALLKRLGLDRKTLKSDYDYFLGSRSGGSAGADAQIGNDELAVEIAKYAEIVAHVQGMSPEEYAGTSREERAIDSVYAEVIRLYEEQGGDMKALEANENYRKVNMERSRKIAAEYMGKHPEQGQEH